MHRRRRALRIGMWTGGLLSFLIAAALVVSFQRSFVHGWNTAAADASGRQRQAFVLLDTGCFELNTRHGSVWPSLFEGLHLSGVTGRGAQQARDAIWPAHVLDFYPTGFRLVLPLWLPLALVLVPTLASAFLLRRHARRPGHCRACGYDLTGNISGRCPECGASCGV